MAIGLEVFFAEECGGENFVESFETPWRRGLFQCGAK